MICKLSHERGIEMSKKKGNKKFEIVVQVTEWKYGHTDIKKYVPKSMFVWAKNRDKALKKFDELHGVSVLLSVKG